MARLMLFTPTYPGGMREKTVETVQAQQFNGELVWEVSEHNPHPIGDMRNVYEQYQLGRQMALDGNYDGVVFIEHDMVLPENCIQVLYDTDAPVVYAAYMLRHGAIVSSLFRKDGNKNLGMSMTMHKSDMRQARKRGWVEVSGVGFGCTLVRRDVLERIPMRYEGGPPDMPFAIDCLRAGIKQIGRYDVACGHYRGEILLTPDMDGGVITKVQALQNVTITVEDQPFPMEEGKYYAIPTGDALEHERAGYVSIIGHAGGRETTEASVARETATATVTKRQPTRRKRTTRKKKDDVSGDTD